jgi:hypothetical protein
MKHFPNMLMLGIFSIPLSAFAQTSEKPACETPAPLAEPWTSWTQSGAVIAGGDSINAPPLILGKPVMATLRPSGYVHYAVIPGRGAGQGQGGLFTLSLKVPARVGIGLSDAAWVDVVDGTSAVVAAEHGHGPDCSGIRKIVWFDLREGLHLVQIAGAPGQEIRIMAADALANLPAPQPDDEDF